MPETTEKNPIISRLNELGIDYERLKSCLDGRDNWGEMIHPFEYLTVCGVVCDAMGAEPSLLHPQEGSKA